MPTDVVEWPDIMSVSPGQTGQMIHLHGSGGGQLGRLESVLAIAVMIKNNFGLGPCFNADTDPK